MSATWKVRFEGRVQGVGFRYTVFDLAKGFDLSGWVKNLPDGAVEMVISGEQEEMEEFLTEIVEESAMAGNIQSHVREEAPSEGVESGFRIVR